MSQKRLSVSRGMFHYSTPTPLLSNIPGRKQTFGDNTCHPERSEGSGEPAEEILSAAKDDRPDPSQARSREVLSPNVYSRGLWIYQSTCRSGACLRPGLPPCVDAFFNGHAIREAP